MELVKVDESKIDICSKFAKNIFINYYTNLIGEKQALYMADLFLSNEAIKKLINKGAIFKIVYENNKPISYIEYIKENNKVFLSKLYVDSNYRNKGYGKYMLDDCINYAKNNNINTIYLTVNKYNTPSINIYKHLNFKIIDAVVNDIGNNYVMDDYIMELSI